jgi:hypothetical protein
MTFKPALWQPIAVVLSAINLVAVGFAAGGAEPYHAAAHAGAALGFGLWAQRLRQPPRRVEGQDRFEAQDRLDALEGDLGDMRRELSEAQERLDFAERVLAKRPEPPRIDPER